MLCYQHYDYWILGLELVCQILDLDLVCQILGLLVCKILGLLVCKILDLIYQIIGLDLDLVYQIPAGLELVLKLQISAQSPYLKHFGVNAHVKLATCLYNDIGNNASYKRIFNDIVITAASKTIFTISNTTVVPRFPYGFGARWWLE